LKKNGLSEAKINAQLAAIKGVYRFANMADQLIGDTYQKINDIRGSSKSPEPKGRSLSDIEIGKLRT
tara:strand:+ start:394 stop:594 length:201 start_codon:yes stop_codon:yes gene_type:complete